MNTVCMFSSVQFDRSAVPDSLRPQRRQHTRLPCPSPTPGACSNSCPPSGWCHPTTSSSVISFSSCLQSFPHIRVFSSKSVLHIRWPKYWSFSFSISPSNEYSGLMSFRMDWLDLLAVQGTLKRLLQHHSSNASILWCSAFFMVQISHPYMTTGKTIALTRRTFVSQVMSLVFNMLSRLVLDFLPRSKCLLISWLQSPSEVILELPQIKSITVSIVSPSICHELMGLDAMILVFWMLWSEVKLLSHVLLFATPWTVAYQAPQSMDIFHARVLQWVPFPPPWDLPDPGIEPGSPTLQADALLSEPPGKPLCMLSFKPTFSLSSFYLV